jgi:hypothetical protein
MADIKVGDNLPEGVTFSYVPYTEDKGDITACGIPINYNAGKGIPSPPPPFPSPSINSSYWALISQFYPALTTPSSLAGHLTTPTPIQKEDKPDN